MASFAGLVLSTRDITQLGSITITCQLQSTFYRQKRRTRNRKHNLKLMVFKSRKQVSWRHSYRVECDLIHSSPYYDEIFWKRLSLNSFDQGLLRSIQFGYVIVRNSRRLKSSFSGEPWASIVRRELLVEIFSDASRITSVLCRQCNGAFIRVKATERGSETRRNVEKKKTRTKLWDDIGKKSYRKNKIIFSFPTFPSVLPSINTLYLLHVFF